MTSRAVRRPIAALSKEAQLEGLLYSTLRETFQKFFQLADQLLLDTPTGAAATLTDYQLDYQRLTLITAASLSPQPEPHDSNPILFC